jgi:ssDNA-binding Zn-finger/Zn-ribbon topoisomerase 1
MSKKRHIILGIGIDCPKCGRPTETRQGTNHGKSFYYSQYDYCKDNIAVFFDEKYKVLAAGQDAQQRFDARMVRKQNRPPERTKTEQEIADQKRAYAIHKVELAQIMNKLKRQSPLTH